MKREIIAIPEFHDRVSPLLDVARNFILHEIAGGECHGLQSIAFNGEGGIGTINALMEMGVSIIICDRVSCHMRRMAACRDMVIISCVQGPVTDVMNRYLSSDMNMAGEIIRCRQRGYRWQCHGHRENKGRYKNEEEAE